MQLEYDLISKQEKNMKVLKSIEGGVTRIIADVPYIAVYDFDIETTVWKRMGVEGSAFVTANDDHKGKKKEDVSKHSFIVLNKKGPEDLVLDLSTVRNIKIQGVYLMVRCAPPTNSNSNAKNGSTGVASILAFWFHQAEDMQKIYHSLTDIVGTSNWKSGKHLLSALRGTSSSNNSSSGSNKVSPSVVVPALASEEKLHGGTSCNNSNSKSSALLALLQASPKVTTSAPAPPAKSPLPSSSSSSSAALLLGAIKQSPTAIRASPSPSTKSTSSNSNSNGQGKQLLIALKSSGSNNSNDIGNDSSSSSAVGGTNSMISGSKNLDSFLDCNIAAAQHKKPSGSSSAITVVDNSTGSNSSLAAAAAQNFDNGGADSTSSSNTSVPQNKGSMLLSALKASPTTARANNSEKFSSSSDVTMDQSDDGGLSSPLSRMILPVAARAPSPDVTKVTSAMPSIAATVSVTPPAPPTASNSTVTNKAKLFSLSDLEGML